MIRPPGIDNGAFVVSPDSVWYARVLLLFTATAQTGTGSKSFDCALVSTLETYAILITAIFVIIDIIVTILIIYIIFIIDVIVFCFSLS